MNWKRVLQNSLGIQWRQAWAQQGRSRKCVKETLLTPVNTLNLCHGLEKSSVVYYAAQGSSCLFICKKEFRLLVKTPALTALWYNA